MEKANYTNTPSHLIPIAGAVEWENRYPAVRFPLICPCGCENFSILYVGKPCDRGGGICPLKIDGEYFYIAKVQCVVCTTVHDVLDWHLHGHEGVVCRDDRLAALPRPAPEKWNCPECGAGIFGAEIWVGYIDEEEFLPGGGYDEYGGMDIHRDAYSAFAMDSVCRQCGTKEKALVEFEAA